MDPIKQQENNPQQNNGSNLPANNQTSLEDFIRQNSTPVTATTPAPAANNSGQNEFNKNLLSAQEYKTIESPSVNSSDIGTGKVIEKVIYKKQRVHGFFRTLTIIALVVIGFLMLIQSLSIFTLNIDGINLNLIYPIFIIFSSIVIWSYKGIFGKLFGLILFLTVVGGFFGIGVYTSLNPATKTEFGSEVSYPTMAGNSSKIFLESLISNLNLKGGQSNNLLEGKYGSDRELFVKSGSVIKDIVQDDSLTGSEEKTPNKQNGHNYLILQEDTNLNLIQNLWSNFDFDINSKKPVYLYFKSFLSKQSINLKDIKWRNIRIYSLATQLDMTLGKQANTGNFIDIQSAASDITINIPKGLGVKLQYKQLVGKTELIDFLETSKGFYQSANVPSATDIVNINIKSGISKLKINWLD